MLRKFMGLLLVLSPLGILFGIGWYTEGLEELLMDTGIIFCIAGAGFGIVFLMKKGIEMLSDD